MHRRVLKSIAVVHAVFTPDVSGRLGARRSRGFTLIELLMVVLIVGVLGATALTSYRDYVIRAQLAQQVLDLGHIREAVDLAVRDGAKRLEVGAVGGRVPPALEGTLAEREFRGPEGLTLQLARTAGTNGADGRYFVLVYSHDPGAARRLGLFYREASRAGFDSRWLTASAFVVGLANAETTVPPGAPAGVTGQGTGAVGGAATGLAGLPASTPLVQQPASAAPTTTGTGPPLARGPAASAAPAKTPAASTPSIPTPPTGATQTQTQTPAPTTTSAPGTSGYCPAGTTWQGNHCRLLPGHTCPAGWHRTGNHCTKI